MTREEATRTVEFLMIAANGNAGHVRRCLIITSDREAGKAHQSARQGRTDEAEKHIQAMRNSELMLEILSS